MWWRILLQMFSSYVSDEEISRNIVTDTYILACGSDPKATAIVDATDVVPAVAQDRCRHCTCCRPRSPSSSSTPPSPLPSSPKTAAGHWREYEERERGWERVWESGEKKKNGEERERCQHLVGERRGEKKKRWKRGGIFACESLNMPIYFCLWAY